MFNYIEFLVIEGANTLNDKQQQSWGRFSWVLIGLAGFVSFCGFGVVFVESHDLLPFWLRLLFLVLSLYGIGLSYLSFYIIKNKKVNVWKNTSFLMLVFLFHFVVFLVILLMLNSYLNDPEEGSSPIIHVGTVILIVGVVYFLRFFEKSKKEEIIEESPEEEVDPVELEKKLKAKKRLSQI